MISPGQRKNGTELLDAKCSVEVKAFHPPETLERTLVWRRSTMVPSQIDSSPVMAEAGPAFSVTFIHIHTLLEELSECLSQGHVGMRTGGSWNRSADFRVSGRPTLPPAAAHLMQESLQSGPKISTMATKLKY